jgi:hypothetical protein
MSHPDRMVEETRIPLMHVTEPVIVYRDYDSLMIGNYRFDLDSIGRLQVALDNVARGIRAYEDGRQGR